MIHELLGGAGLLAGERKVSVNGGILDSTSPPSLSSSSSPSPPAGAAATPTTQATSTNSGTPTTKTSTNTSSNSENQNLRCPRCDSSNTKFCYYNNYNLTQPRHFCKTCRRYWTKGGALRNVPIGGGCRKNKTTTMSATVGKSSSSKMKTTLATEIGRSGFNGFDHGPILWGSPQSSQSHLLALLRATQNPNPSQNTSLIHNSLMNEPTQIQGRVMGLGLGLDPLSSHVSSLGLCSSYWKNNNHQTQQQNGLLAVDSHSNSGIHEVYQRLKSSSGANYFSENQAIALNNVAAATSSSPSSSLVSLSMLESAPLAAGEMSYWNPAFSWSDLPTTNGAYP